MKKRYEAIVVKLIEAGKHGPYAVARLKDVGLVTFSLEPKVWQERDWPELGTYVVLEGLIKKRAGWRAQQGRYLNPTDEERRYDSSSTEK